jgi:hypothetical protein
MSWPYGLQRMAAGPIMWHSSYVQPRHPSTMRAAGPNAGKRLIFVGRKIDYVSRSAFPCRLMVNRQGVGGVNNTEMTAVGVNVKRVIYLAVLVDRPKI